MRIRIVRERETVVYIGRDLGRCRWGRLRYYLGIVFLVLLQEIHAKLG